MTKAAQPTTDFERTLSEAFSPEWLKETAKKTGLIKRERKISPVVLFWVLVLSFGVQLQRTLADLKRSYEKSDKIKLSDGSWYERFSPELVLFLRECVAHGLEHIAKTRSRVLSEKLTKFEDVQIMDSTVIRLSEKLAKRFPATRSRKIAAGVKVNLLVSCQCRSKNPHFRRLKFPQSLI